METIKNYLDNMFMGLPKTPQVQRAREELLAMMEDKYQELKAEGKTENEAIGIVISEFGNLEELAESLGISGYMKEEQERGEWNITSDNAREYIDETGKYGIRIGIGVMCCILSPVILLILGGASETPSMRVSENLAGGLGILILLVMVAVGVAFFILSSYAYQKYESLKKEEFWLDYETEAWVKEEKQDFQGGFAVSITLGVVLCVLSVVPICLAGMLFSVSVFAQSICVGFLLIMVSVGVFLFIMAGMKNSAYEVLLHEGEYSRKKKRSNKILDTVSSVYWSIVTCVYLGFSFLSGNWGSSWLIWPVAGILYGAVSGIIKAAVGHKE